MPRQCLAGKAHARTRRYTDLKSQPANRGTLLFAADSSKLRLQSHEARARSHDQ